MRLKGCDWIPMLVHSFPSATCFPVINGELTFLKFGGLESKEQCPTWNDTPCKKNRVSEKMTISKGKVVFKHVLSKIVQGLF